MTSSQNVKNVQVDPTQRSEENRKLVEEGTKKIKEKLENDANAVKKDRNGYVVLEKLCQYMWGEETSGTGTNNKDEVKENINENNFSGMSQMWETFKSAAREIAKFAADFLRQLKDAPIKMETKKEIAAVCRQFKRLLQSTSKKLQAYRLDIQKMIDTFDLIIEVLIPPEDECEDLMELSKRERLKQVESFAKENKYELKDRLKDLSDQMKDNKNLKDLQTEIEKWGLMKRNIERVIKKVSQDLKKFRRKMQILVGITCIVGAALIIAAAIGTAGSAVGALFFCGMQVGKIVMVVGGLTCGALAIIGSLLLIYPEFGEALKIAKNKTIDAITDGLKRIAEQSDVLESILDKIYKQWVEVMSNDPKGSYREWAGKIKASGLLKKLYQTRKGLEELKTSIKETETVCQEQLSSYTKTIYRPLLDLYL